MFSFLKKMTRIRVHFSYLAAAVFAAALCFSACNHPAEKNKEDKTVAAQWQQHRLQLYNDTIFPKAIAVVHSGDMVTRLGTDITSEMLRQMNQADQSFSHCGIASIENDTVFIYHAIGGEFNPDQKIKRETLYSFGHPHDNKSIGIFRPATDSSKIKTLLSIAQGAFQNGMPFDMDFDYATDDRQYCAEFVAKSYSRAIADSSWFSFSTKGKFQYLAVDNLFQTTLMKEVLRFSY